MVFCFKTSFSIFWLIPDIYFVISFSMLAMVCLVTSSIIALAALSTSFCLFLLFLILWIISAATPTIPPTTAAIGVSTANNYGYTDRENKPFYLLPVPAKARTVIVSTTDSTLDTVIFRAAKITGDTYTRVDERGFDTNFSYSFSQGTINYIGISLRRSDGESVPWGFDDAKIQVKFTNR